MRYEKQKYMSALCVCVFVFVCMSFIFCLFSKKKVILVVRFLRIC